MNENTFFLHQIKCTNGVYSKGIVVHETYDAALQGYHAYLGAYAYGHEQGTDFVDCAVTDRNGALLIHETWKPKTPEVQPEA